MDIKQSTIEAAIALLNVHKRHCRNKETGTKEQKAYYKGLGDMAELILSNNYTHNGCRVAINEDESGNFVFNGIYELKKEADI